MTWWLRYNTWLLLLTIVCVLRAQTDGTFNVQMPDIRSDQNDDYICTAVKLDKEAFITKFEAIHDPEVTHHMILFSCAEPGSKSESWKCGMHVNSSPVCRDGEQILFSWAMEAPNFDLPRDISFPVGGEKAYLVLQVHYKDASAFENDPSRVDKSGFKLTSQDTPTSKLAGVYVLIGNGKLQPHSEDKISVECSFDGKTSMHPFAFRVHAHSHGVKNIGNVNHGGESYLIGEKSPQEPQTFYPVENKSLVIHRQDGIEATCEMKNDEDRVIGMGMTRNDEMCNFYIMYWVPQEDRKVLYDPAYQLCVAPPMEEVQLPNFDELEDEILEDSVW